MVRANRGDSILYGIKTRKKKRLGERGERGEKGYPRNKIMHKQRTKPSPPPPPTQEESIITTTYRDCVSSSGLYP